MTLLPKEFTWLSKTGSFINNQFSNGDDCFNVVNPYDQTPIATVAKVTASEVTQAVKFSAQAQKNWQQQPAKKRGDILLAWAKLMRDKQQALATIITLEQGKPLSESMAEVAYATDYLQWYGEQTTRIKGEILPAPSFNQQLHVVKQAIGVCAAITPFNFPIAMMARKVAAALAAGCSMIVKPAETTPLSALASAKLAHDAGVPHGLLSVLTTDNPESIGKQLTDSAQIKKISFTGSTKTGKQLLKQASNQVQKTSMELGGNAPFIVFKSADIDKVIQGAIACKFRNAGQTCICANRFLVDESIAAVFTKKLTQAVKALIIGNGLDSNSQIGPLINQAAVKKVQGLVDNAIHQGAQPQLPSIKLPNRNFIQPQVLTQITADMDIWQQEIFGPIVSIKIFKQEEEAIQLANATQYGLAAYVYSQDVKQIYRAQRELDYGMIGINETAISNPIAPFGGFKHSGMGKEGGEQGINEYLQEKYICTGDLF